MAIYHLSAKVIQRSQGRSAIAAAAYRAAAALHDESLGRTFNYLAKSGLVHSEILLPEGAPARWLDRAALWKRGGARRAPPRRGAGARDRARPAARAERARGDPAGARLRPRAVRRPRH